MGNSTTSEFSSEEVSPDVSEGSSVVVVPPHAVKHSKTTKSKDIIFNFFILPSPFVIFCKAFSPSYLIIYCWFQHVSIYFVYFDIYLFTITKNLHFFI